MCTMRGIQRVRLGSAIKEVTPNLIGHTVVEIIINVGGNMDRDSKKIHKGIPVQKGWEKTQDELENSAPIELK